MTGPVIAGAAQLANKDGERIVHPVTLLEEVARRALDDAGLAASAVGAVFATPLSVFSQDNAGVLVAERLGLAPGPRSESSYSGAAPLRMLREACRMVDEGEVEAALVVGGIADASVRRARLRGDEPPAPPTSIWSQGSDGVQDHRLRGPAWEGYSAEAASGAGMPSHFFALVESAIGDGLDPAVHRARLGALLAPFTSVAASRPDVAWFPTPRSPDEIATPAPENRFIAEPYTKLMCSFPTVDLAAAVVVTRATEGVRPMGLVAAREEQPPSGRTDIGRSIALTRAAERALALAGVGVADLAGFDLYSCFPSAVQLALRALDVPLDDPRPFTLTGGLPYFGGPGASYSLHGLVCSVEALRARPDSLVGVVGLGGMINDFAVGVFGVTDAPFRSDDLGKLDEGSVPLRPVAAGLAVVDAMTVTHERDGVTGAPVIARLPDGARVGARALDPDVPAASSGTTLVGREVVLEERDGKVLYRLD